MGGPSKVQCVRCRIKLPHNSIDPLGQIETE